MNVKNEYGIYSTGEVPKLAEGTPLERVQVVNSGARVQIPPSPLAHQMMNEIKKLLTSTDDCDSISELLKTTKNIDN